MLCPYRLTLARGRVELVVSVQRATVSRTKRLRRRPEKRLDRYKNVRMVGGQGLFRL